MPTPPTPPRAARIAVAATFAANGALMGTWIARIPEVKADLGLSPAVLGFVLLAPAVGSLLAMPLTGAAAARVGSPRTTRAALAAFCLVPGFIGMSDSVPTLWLALFVWGATIGGLDVAMNAQGVTVEKHYLRPVLSSFHAAWSLGSFTGVVVGGLLLHVGVSITAQLAAGGLLLLAAVGPLTRSFLPDPPNENGPGSLFARPHGRLLLLGLAGFAGLLTEGAASDWSGVYLRESLGVPTSLAGLGFAAFAATMTLGRLAGDRVTARLGRVRTVRTLSGLGTVGIAAGLLGGSLWPAVLGFGMLGLGLSTVVPIVFAAAGDDDASAGPSIAAVATCGYVGFLAGPTAIGLLAEVTTLPIALALLPILTAVLWLVAPAVGPTRTQSVSPLFTTLGQ